MFPNTPVGNQAKAWLEVFNAGALQKNKLLSRQYTEMLTTGKVDTPMGAKYAYGFMDENTNGTRCFGHGGGAPGMNGELHICPGPGYVIAVLANFDPPAATRVADFITKSAASGMTALPPLSRHSLDNQIVPSGKASLSARWAAQPLEPKSHFCSKARPLKQI